MEIKQLEYFVAAAEHKSLNRAAKQLYTSQPNVSKVIANLEKEIGSPLFHRTNKGIALTEQGEKIYDYAMVILKNADVMMAVVREKEPAKFSVSGYQSNLLTRLLTQYYLEHGSDQFRLEYREGTAEEITDHVSRSISELGIVYVTEKQMSSFLHIIGHKELEFHSLKHCGICVYAGQNHPYYERQTIAFKELKELKFVCGTDDFFSMEHHLRNISVGTIHIESMNNVVCTNSDYMINNMLQYTDVCCLGIEFISKEYKKQGIRGIRVENFDQVLILGYVKAKNKLLSKEGEWFINQLKIMLSKQ